MSRELEARNDVVEEASLESFPASDAPAWTLGEAAHAGPEPGVVAMKSTAETLADGVLAGIIGYAVIALFFAVTSVLSGYSPFHIAALLGSVLFFGHTGGPVAVEPGTVLAYNGAHMLVFIAAGLILAWLARVAAQALQGWYIALMAVFFTVGHVVALPLWFGGAVQAVLAPWLMAAGTAAATIAMIVYLWYATPGIRAAMHEPDEPG